MSESDAVAPPEEAGDAADKKVDGRRARHAHRRGELVRAAGDYITAHGFAELSMRPLAAGIGVSHATLLHHFGTKEALLAEVLQELRDRERLVIAAQSERLRGAPLDVILRTVWAHLSAPANRPYWNLVFRALGTALADPAQYSSYLEGATNDWLGLGEEVLAAAGCPPPHRAAMATVLVGALRGILIDLLVTGDRTRTDQAVERLAADAIEQVRRLQRPATHRPA